MDWLSGVCSGASDQVVISFNQPVDDANDVISIAGADTDTILLGWYVRCRLVNGKPIVCKWNGSLWIKQNDAPNSNEAKIYIQPSDNLCITTTARVLLVVL